MLQRFLNHQIAKAERDLGVKLDYARWIARVSPATTWRIARFTKLLQAGTGPTAALKVASIVGAMADDCGECVQIGINLARQAGVSCEVLEAVVHGNPDALPAELGDVYRFAEAVTRDTAAQDELRERVRSHYGDRGLLEISLAVAMHRVFPTLKRGLGFAKSCSLTPVEV